MRTPDAPRGPALPHPGEDAAERLFALSVDALCLVGVDGRFQRVNPALEEMVGIPAEELVGTPLVDLVHPDDLGDVRKQLARLATDNGVLTLTARFRRRDGGHRWLSWRSSPADGQGIIYAVARDVTERVLADAALAAAEQRWRALLEHASDGIIISRADGRLFVVNERTSELTGYARDELLGMTIADLVAPEEVLRLPLQYPRLRPGERVLIERSIRRRDGTCFPAEVSARAMEDGSIKSIVRDITDRRRAEEALRASEALFRSAFEHAGIGMALTSLDGTFTRVNPALTRLVGYEERELVGKPFAAITHPDDVAMSFVPLLRAQTGDLEAYALEKRYRHKLGHDVWVQLHVALVHDASGAPAFFVAQVQDISEYKRAGDALRESERRFRGVLESVSAIGVILDTSGHVTFCNDFLLDLTGWTRDEVLGHDWFARFVPDQTEVAKVFCAAMRTGSIDAHFENDIVTRDGGRRTISWDNTVLRAPDGTVVGTASLGRDITDRRLLETQLQHAQKMEAVGRLAGGVAHDFNNLLVAISLNAEVALDALAPDDARRAELVEIRKAGERAAQLTRQLLAFSRKQVLRPALIDLNALVTDLDRMLRRLIGEDVTIATLPAPRLRPVLADRGQLEQVLVNLVVNARDAMPDGGTLTIETANVAVDASVARWRGTGAATGPYVLLAVADTGHGMPPEVRARIFEPFFTTKDAGQGTGLGLSTVYGIVRQSGGFIEVDSLPGHGSTFRIYLPASASGHPTPAGNPALTMGGHETILLVEDENAVRRVARRLLERQGYTVIEARNGPDALRVAAATQGRLDLMVTDVVMPEMNGSELAAQMLQQRPELRVLFMSGYADTEIVRRGMLAPGTAFLEKPFTALALAAAVRAVLDGRDV